ncbi:TPA: cell division protein YceG, partial [Haemophilus influenzae]
MKKFLIAILLLILILAGVASFGYYKMTEFVKTPVNAQADQLLTIERGTTGSK